MARKSRKNQVQPVPVLNEPAIRAALYIRLSVEDTRSGSISIETQKMILDRYLEGQPEIFVYDTYIDNGATGTNFRRSGFQRMLSDIEAGYVNCVIVKDLSRLGRNSIDTGYYIEQYFPQHQVRFIAITDQYDSNDPDDIHAGIILPLKNMINEAYALDIGRKIKAQQRQAMRDGEFVGGRPPYGYLKAPDNCHKLVVDPITAPVVRQMFEWAAAGAGLNTIVVRLNAAKILPPSQYKKSIGQITHENLMGNGSWQTRTVTNILHREIYTGDLVQGHTKTVDHRQMRACADNLITVRGTHEAIISRELFESVQTILSQTAEKAKNRQVKPYTPNLLKGKVFCAHCGKPLHRQRQSRRDGDDYYFFYCLTPSRVVHDENVCPGVNIRENKLLPIIQAEICRNLSSEKALAQLQPKEGEAGENAAISAEIREHECEVQNLRARIGGLYEDLLRGVLDKEEYLVFKSKYDTSIAEHEDRIASLKKQSAELERQDKRRRSFSHDANLLAHKPELALDLIDRLVERVEVTHEGQVQITFNYQGSEDRPCRNMKSLSTFGSPLKTASMTA